MTPTRTPINHKRLATLWFGGLGLLLAAVVVYNAGSCMAEGGEVQGFGLNLACQIDVARV